MLLIMKLILLACLLAGFILTLDALATNRKARELLDEAQMQLANAIWLREQAARYLAECRERAEEPSGKGE